MYERMYTCMIVSTCLLLLDIMSTDLHLLNFAFRTLTIVSVPCVLDDALCFKAKYDVH